MTDLDEKRYTARDLVLAWELGVEYARSQDDVLAVYDDHRRAAENIQVPSVPYEERVRIRIAEMEAAAVEFRAKHGVGGEP